jgi:hypothetical protein
MADALREELGLMHQLRVAREALPDLFVVSSG